jgi:hypothetical protein
MTTSIVSKSNGSQSALQVNGLDSIVFDSTGIVSGDNNILNKTIGVNQTWQDVTGSRVAETTYYNTTGRPICISLALLTTNINSYSVFYINGVFVGEHGGNTVAPVRSQIYAVIPIGASYQFHNIAAAVTIDAWSELR